MIDILQQLLRETRNDQEFSSLNQIEFNKLLADH